MEDAVQLFGLFFFCAAAMETVDLLAIAVVVTTIIVSGLFYCFYAVADAVERYKAWQSEKLGRDINPSKLTEMVMETGVKRVEIRQPAYTVLSDGSRGVVPDLAVIGSTTIINGGVEEE